MIGTIVVIVVAGLLAIFLWGLVKEYAVLFVVFFAVAYFMSDNVGRAHAFDFISAVRTPSFVEKLINNSDDLPDEDDISDIAEEFAMPAGALQGLAAIDGDFSETRLTDLATEWRDIAKGLADSEESGNPNHGKVLKAFCAKRTSPANCAATVKDTWKNWCAKPGHCGE